MNRVVIVLWVMLMALAGCEGSRHARDGAGDASADVCRLEVLPETPICCGKKGEVPGSTCFERAGIEANLMSCVAEGRRIDAKLHSLGILCCAGLLPIEDAIPTDGGTAESLPVGCGFVSLLRNFKVCARCGDGACGPGENRCNCVPDCS
jgi:hypothetical protein